MLQKKRISLRRKTSMEIVWPMVFLAPFVICFLLFNIYPILYTFFSSFYQWDGISEKIFVGFSNYKRILLQDVNFRRSVTSTLRILLCSYPIAIFMGLIMAAFISNLKKGSHIVQTVNFLPYITTPVAVGLIFSFLFDRSSGIVNRLLAAVGMIDEHINWLGDPKTAFLVVSFMIIWKTTGYYMTLYAAGISSVSEEIYEAAKVDGANVWVIFWKIMVPLLKPITIFAVVTSLINGLQLFDECTILFSGNAASVKVVGGPQRSCLTIIWNFYDVAFMSDSRLGYASAIAILLFVIILVLAILGLKFMNRKEDGK